MEIIQNVVRKYGVKAQNEKIWTMTFTFLESLVFTQVCPFVLALELTLVCVELINLFVLIVIQAKQN